jgi:hypothetical protein
MGLIATFTVICDICESDTGDSRPTKEEALDYATRGGWSVYKHSPNLILCEDCVDFWIEEHADES